MLTAMTEEDWTIVLRVFAASRSNPPPGAARAGESRVGALVWELAQ